MLKGLLIVNNFINNRISDRFQALYEMLLSSFKKYNLELELKTNAEILSIIDEDIKELYDYVLFWDKDIFLAKHLENLGLKVFNSSHAIEICDDKAKTALALENNHIPMPKTIIAPFSFDNYDFDSNNNFDFLNTVVKKLGFPLIIKEGKGSFGEQVYLVHNLLEMKNILKNITNRSVIFQEYISSSYGFDTRIMICGGKFLGAVKRISQTNDFRSNVLQGGIMEPFVPNQEFIDLAIKVCDIIGLDFAGVDLMFSNDNRPIFCEVNSNVHFKTFYKTTGINLANAIAKYIIEKLQYETK